MAAFNKFRQFVEDIAKKVHNLNADTLRNALTNTAPVNTQEILDTTTNHPAPAAANGYSLTQAAITSCEQTTGILKLILVDVVFTATAGGIGPFRYTILYNDTPTSPADPLIGWYDYGSSITLAVSETFTVDYDAAAGVLTIE